MKLNLIKHKRVLWIASAVLIVVILFFAKNRNLFESTVKYLGGNKKTGLVYDPNAKMVDLINKSTTGDGIPDWEKILWGLDPTKTENVPGVPDSVTIAKLQAQAGDSSSETTSSTNENTGKITQTDQFSRELLATITTMQANGAIDKNGNMDQTTFDNLTKSLANGIQNTPQRKIYQLSDIKIINDNSITAVKKYNTSLNSSFSSFQKNSDNGTIMDILQKFAPDETGNNTDPSVLSQLTPIVINMTNSLNQLIMIPVPQALATLHLYMINDLEGMIENLTDLQQYSTDPIVAFSGMNKYVQNSSLFNQVSLYIAALIDMKLDTSIK